MADISYCSIDKIDCPLASTCKRWISNKVTDNPYYSVTLFRSIIDKNKTTCDYYIELINRNINKLGD